MVKQHPSLNFESYKNIHTPRTQLWCDEQAKISDRFKIDAFKTLELSHHPKREEIYKTALDIVLKAEKPKNDELRFVWYWMKKLAKLV